MAGLLRDGDGVGTVDNGTVRYQRAVPAGSVVDLQER
jgi:hypothetical protein